MYAICTGSGGLGLGTCISWPASGTDLLNGCDLEEKILVDEAHFVSSLGFGSPKVVCEKCEEDEWAVSRETGEKVWFRQIWILLLLSSLRWNQPLMF